MVLNLASVCVWHYQMTSQAEVQLPPAPQLGTKFFLVGGGGIAVQPFNYSKVNFKRNLFSQDRSKYIVKERFLR